ncbi:hypothetical protein D3C80_1873400 [compost metagenome]
MATSAGSHGDQAIDACLGGFLRVPARSDVVKHQPAITMHGIDQLFHRAQAGDHDRYLVFYTDSEVRLQARVALMDDQVDRVRGRLVQGFKA